MGDTLHAHFGCGVDIHGFRGRRLRDGEVRKRNITLGVGNAIDGNAGGKDYFLDAEFTGSFYYGVRAEGVDAEGFVVGDAVWLGNT